MEAPQEPVATEWAIPGGSGGYACIWEGSGRMCANWKGAVGVELPLEPVPK